VHDACVERDLDPATLVTEDGDYTVEGGHAAMLRILERPVRGRIAVFAANDLMALGAMMAVRDAGLECPDDVSLLGFDGVPAGAFCGPGLTTVEKPARALGRRASEELLSVIAGQAGPPTRIYLPSRLIERGSVLARTAGTAEADALTKVAV
jgi:LacI family transcriptional regulator